MIRRLDCSIALMCLTPESSFFGFREKESKFLYSCRCRDHHREYRPAAHRDSFSPDNSISRKTRKPSFFRKWAGFHLDFSKDAAGDAGPGERHAITGGVNLIGPEIGGELLFTVRDERKSYEVNVAIPCTDGNSACEIRKEIARWSDVAIAITGKEARHSFISRPMVTLTGNAFFSKDHALADTAFGNFYPGGGKKSTIAIWELQPIISHNFIPGA